MRHLIGTAAAWGGNPDKDAIYLNVTPARNDGTTIYKLNVPAKVPVNAFWSVIVYDAEGHLQKNQYNSYSLNSITAKKNADGSIPMQFGGCDGKIPNCMPTMKGWNYMVRLYRPRDEILERQMEISRRQSRKLSMLFASERARRYEEFDSRNAGWQVRFSCVGIPV